MIVFDLDDTLYLESTYVESGHRAVAEIFGRRFGVLPDVLLKVMNENGNPFENITNTFMKDKSEEVCDAAIKTMVEIYRYHFPEIQLESSVVDTLNQLAKTHRLGVITDGRSITQRNKFKALGLERYIEDNALIISEEIGGDKHCPLPFLTIQKRYQNEKHFIYVGDNPEKDFLQPNLLGWTTIIVKDLSGKNVHPQKYENVSHDALPQMSINRIENLLEMSFIDK